MRLTGHIKDEWAPDSGMFEGAIAQELAVRAGSKEHAIITYTHVCACICVSVCLYV
jgi:hypothetical protein